MILKTWEKHCHNSHVWLTLGDILTMNTPTYSEMRNRECEDCGDWLSAEMKDFLSGKLQDNNQLLSSQNKRK